MDFLTAHSAFIQYHLERRNGERRARLDRGHRHAEKLFLRNVWWVLKGNFEYLHPEYEVSDWRGRPYFADFAWLQGIVKLIIEIKGYATHVRDMDREKYSNELNRETFLSAMGYEVICFAYDDVEQRPDVCITLLRMVLSKYQPDQAPVSRALLGEKELVRLAIQNVEPIRPVDVASHFEIDQKTAILMLRKLCSKGWMKPSLRGNGERNVRYKLTRGVFDYLD